MPYNAPFSDIAAMVLESNLFKSAILRTSKAIRGPARPYPSLFYLPGLESRPGKRPCDEPPPS